MNRPLVTRHSNGILPVKQVAGCWP
ncbi:hypothetical protein BLAT2472_30061 [Burkholderia latens]